MTALVHPKHDPERRPPAHVCDLDAERAVLGAAFLDPDVVGWLEVDEREFFGAHYRAVWRVMRALHAADTPVDPLTVEAELARRGQSDSIGGLPGLSDLAMSVPTAANVEHYAEILRTKRINRDVAAAAGQVDALVKSGTEGPALLDELLGDLGRIELPAGDQVVSAEDAVAAELAAIDRYLAGGTDEAALPTGIERLDEMCGGVPIGQPTIVAARPSVGKSTTVLHMVDHVTEDPDAGAIIFTYEDRRPVWARRLLARKTGIDYTRIRLRRLSSDELLQLQHAHQKLLRRTNLRIVHAHGMKAPEIARIATSWARKLKLKLIAVDYLQNMPNPERGMQRTYGIEENVRILETCIAKLECAGVLVSQLKRLDERAVRGPTNRGEDSPSVREEKRMARIAARRPGLEDLKDSGAIEQKGKLVLALNNDPELDAGVLEALILKQNEGPTNKVIPLEVDFSTGRIVRCIPPPQTSFHDYAPHAAEAQEGP